MTFAPDDAERFQDAGRRERPFAGHGVREDEFLLHAESEGVTLRRQKSRVHGLAPSLGRTAQPRRSGSAGEGPLVTDRAAFGLSPRRG